MKQMTPYELAEKRRRLRIKIRRLQKQQTIANCSMMAKIAKAKLILRDKGRNGHSMSDELLSAHGIQRKGEQP